MGFDWASSRASVTRMITKYGGRAILRRDSGDRFCTAGMIRLRTGPRQGQLRNMPDRTFLVVADEITLTVTPDPDQDHLVTLDPITGAEVESFKLIAPVGKVAPGGVVLYWRLQVSR